MFIKLLEHCNNDHSNRNINWFCLGKLLIGLGVSESGYSKTFEVIDLDDPLTECETLEDYPVPRESSIGFVNVDEEPVICGGFGNGTAK